MYVLQSVCKYAKKLQTYLSVSAYACSLLDPFVINDHVASFQGFLFILESGNVWTFCVETSFAVHAGEFD